MSPLPLPAESGVRLAVLGELASGGMGRVDLARIVGSEGAPSAGARGVALPEGHVVAVKRLHPHLARDQHFVAMFLDEVRVTGSLRHSNVVELVGWGRDEEGIFLAMEFVHGAPLSHVARSGRSAGEPLPAELIAFVGARIATGLAAAHDLRGTGGESLGLIHRDVTPSNVLLGFDGSVKITDFGVAKAAGSTTHTATGVLKGKVSYMSPEYARGHGFDRRSDLYSAAVVLFELATGVRPFTADHDLELLRLIAEEEPPPIAAFAPSFNKSLAELIHRMLDKDPEARPPDGEAVRDELDRWLLARGYDLTGLERALAAYVGRHAADRRADVARLLESPGEISGDRSARATAKRTRTLTVLLGSEPLTFLDASHRSVHGPGGDTTSHGAGGDTADRGSGTANRGAGGDTARRAARGDATSREPGGDTPPPGPPPDTASRGPGSARASGRAGEPKTRALVRPGGDAPHPRPGGDTPHPRPGRDTPEPGLDPGASRRSAPPSAKLEPEIDLGSEDANTEPLTRKADLLPAGSRGARAASALEAMRSMDDETDTGLVAPRGSGAVPPSLPPPARTRLIAAGIASFLIVACGLFAVLALTRRRTPAVDPAPAAQTPSSVGEVAVSAEIPPPPREATSPEPVAPSAAPSAGLPAPVPSASATSRAASAVPSSAPKRRCTPADFDYPRCLSRSR